MIDTLRKRLFAVGLFIVSGYTVHGQEIHVGIKAGLNYTNVSKIKFRYASNNLDTESPESRFGTHAGIYAELILPFPVSVQPEFSYSRQGFKFESGQAKAEARLNYFELPVLFKYRIIPMVHVFIGPQVSFLSNTSYDYSGTYRNYELEENQTTFSGLAGAGITLGRFDINARYGRGFSDVFKEDDLSADKGSFLQLSAGFRLFSVNK